MQIQHEEKHTSRQAGRFWLQRSSEVNTADSVGSPQTATLSCGLPWIKREKWWLKILGKLARTHLSYSIREKWVGQRKTTNKKKKKSWDNSCLIGGWLLLPFVNVIVPLWMSDSSALIRQELSEPRLDTVFYDRRCKSAKEAKRWWGLLDDKQRLPGR